MVSLSSTLLGHTFMAAAVAAAAVQTSCHWNSVSKLLFALFLQTTPTYFSEAFDGVLTHPV